MPFREINFSPFFNNIIDFTGDCGLVTISGRKIKVVQSSSGFDIHIDDEPIYKDLGNIAASYILNQMQTGKEDG